MAEGKRGVLIYADWIKKFETLKDDEAGRLVKHLFRYINDLNPESPDRITELSFIDIEITLKRDLVKWEQKAEKSRLNGKLGGRPITQHNPEEPKITQQVILEPKEPVIVSVIDSVIVNDINNIEGIKPTPKSLEVRKEEFRISLIPLVEEYSKKTVRDFFEYWSEHKEGGNKMAFEMKKTFNLKLRIKKWKLNEANFDKKPQFNNQQQPTIKTYEFNEQ